MSGVVGSLAGFGTTELSRRQQVDRGERIQCFSWRQSQLELERGEQRHISFSDGVNAAPLSRRSSMAQ